MTTEPITPQTDQNEFLTADDGDDAELVEAAEQAEQDATGEHIVAFGCRAADCVYLAAVPGQRQKSYTLTIPQCPGCGEPHEIKAMPRRRDPHDEIALTVDPPPVLKPTVVSGATPKSDADVIAALSDDWTLVTEVAEKLGYGNRGSFVNRLREMRQRNAPIETRQKHRTAPLYVRRAAA